MKHVRSIARLLVVLAGAVALNARATDQVTELQFRGPVAPLKSSVPPTAFWERFDSAWERGANDAFRARFHPLQLIHQDLRNPRTGADLVEHTSSSGRRAFEKSVVYAARESAVDLPIFLWLKDREGFFTDLLRNSVGNVEEEEVGALDVSYRPVERSWWRRLSESGQLRYGLRPFKTNPYAFLSLGLKDGDRLLLLGNLRYHWDHFSDHRFEVAMSLPLSHGFAVDFGTSYEFGRHQDEKRLVVKLFRELNKNSLVHVGFEVREHPVLFAGFTSRW